MNATTQAEPEITVRRFQLDDLTDLPRYWFYDSAVLTHATNALNLLFPEGERFFVRSVRHYIDRIDDPELRARVDAFIGQEAQHGRAHEQTFAILDAFGLEYEDWLAWYRKVAYDWLEPNVPASLRLATTAATEHFTATMATYAFTDGRMDAMDPRLRDLYLWHAAEEIEHKAVAYDVFMEVDGRYPVRMAGLAVATAGLALFWTSATRHLLRQDGVSQAQIREEQRAAKARGQTRRRYFIDGILSYVRPGFHPDDIDNRGLARDWLASVGRLRG